MKWPEKEAEYLKDMSVLEGRKPYIEKELRKKLKKGVKTFPHYEILDITTKYHNRYLWLFKFFDKKSLKLFNYQCKAFALLQGDGGIYVYSCFENDFPKEMCSILIAPHFFSRYAKRTHQKFPTALDSIKTYLSRNFPLIVKKSVAQDEETGSSEYTAFAPSTEGVGLGNFDPIYKGCTLLKTFISHDLLKGDQPSRVNACLEEIRQIDAMDKENHHRRHYEQDYGLPPIFAFGTDGKPYPPCDN